ncbi:glycoside hydrolase superfamily [Mycena albidolilacea]|uniref:beta-N-acetylhexosaminidase n=1 Tax=Mycena albidolilacea TaxID=1033008 RepID=A0AAD7ARF6_9AGAR|nr:glycoside hydrolase superfamily [Mycena albidolilacea]
MRLLSLAAAAAASVLTVFAETLVGIPTFNFNATSTAHFSLSSVTHVLVDSRFQNTVDTEGKTLIPPTLLAFGTTFAADLLELGLSVPVEVASAARPGSIFLTLAGDPGVFLDAAGRPTSEGYELSVGTQGVVVAGASPLGAFWGTRTIMQLAKLGGLALPIGSGRDAPGWGTRGVMLDAGRHYYSPSFLTELCAYLSFFKQNTFHLHLSDNLFNNVGLYSRERSLDLYAAFRLHSDDPAVAGLVRPYRFNESYTRETFDEMQASCAARGVTIIPELEAPGHALVIAQWKPELALDDLSLLNISHPETIPTMEAIWRTFLPWFHSKTVHIGADEYDSSLANDYIRFVNTLSAFINATAAKDTRIWGTNEPSNTSVVTRAITIQHWEFFEDSPLVLIRQNYSVLNADDAFYIVGKFSGSYPQTLNLTRIFAGNPAGGAFAPYVFDTSNAANNPARGDPRVVGHVAAQWNDYGPNATVVSEAYYAWRDALPALADKQWGGALTRAQYDSVFGALHAVIPGQNLDRAIKSKGDVILRYDFAIEGDGVVPAADSSGNGYDGVCHACSISDGVASFASPASLLTTPLSSKGRNYTLSFSIKPSSAARIGAPILSGADSALVLGNGTVPHLMLISGNQPYALNYTLPRDVWTDVALIGRGNATFLRAGVGAEMQFLAILGINGESFQWKPIAIEAPLAQIGGDGFLGSVAKFELRGSA